MKHRFSQVLALLLVLLLGVQLSGSLTACTPSASDPVKGSSAPESETPQADTTEDDTTEDDTTEINAPETQPFMGHFSIIEQQGSTTFTSKDGFSYVATGYDNVDTQTGAVTFSQALSLRFTSRIAYDKFNRFTVTYSSDQPIKLFVGFAEDQPEELFFLEAGTGDFSAVLSGFLSKKFQHNVTSLRIEPCAQSEVCFSLAALSTEIIPIPDQTCYLENQRFKLGIALHWGGTISYLEDKTADIDGVINLVNCHDTGRLIQQSYYGTLGEDNDYEPSVSFGSTWHYNPVQGGDQYGVGGRLVDIRFTENSIYIKSQPCDWAKNGSFTPFYTENTYTLQEDCIQVDNRATDFSGWEHPYKHQELPAVYVISYLDTFVCYNGDRPWTDDDLTVLRDLPFWDHGTQIAYFNEKNTETWFAWYSEEDSFGLGAYAPGIDTIGGGQSQPGVRDKSDVSNATNYASGCNLLQIKAFEPITYSYLLTTGSPEQIRSTFKARQDFTDNAYIQSNSLPQEPPYKPATAQELTDLDLSKAINGIISVTNSKMEYDVTEQAIKLTTISTDTFINVQYSNADVTLHAKDYSILKIVYMIPVSNQYAQYNAELYPCAGKTTSPSAETLMWIPGLIKDGTYHTLVIDLTKSAVWEGEVHKLRFDHFNNSELGDVMYIKGITLE